MTPQDAETIVAIAALAAQSDGQQDEAEQTRITEMAAGLGVSPESIQSAMTLAKTVGVPSTVARLAEKLSDVDARHAAYDTAVSVCNADGWVNPNEAAFLRTLASALQIDPTATDRRASEVHDEIAASTAGASAGAAAAASAAFANTATPNPEPEPTQRSSTAPKGAIDDFILDQAMLSAALELLPDKLANLGILPLQLRMVQQIGERHGQQMNASQVKDLAAVFGIGAAAQIMEKVVRGALGGLAGRLGAGMLGGMLGGAAGSAAGFAAGAAVTFATTYAVGHAAEQYYAQNRSLSTSDMKQLFERFKGEANTVYPRAEARIRELASSGNIGSVLRAAPR